MIGIIVFAVFLLFFILSIILGMTIVMYTRIFDILNKVYQIDKRVKALKNESKNNKEDI